MKFQNNKILCIGEVLWDVFGENRKPGGAPLNVALHLNKLGNNVNIVSRLGKDEDGIELNNFIKSKGLDTCNLQVDEIFQTSRVIVSLDDSGNAGFVIQEPVAWDNLEFRKDLEILSINAGIIVYGTLASRTLKSRTTITESLKNRSKKIIDVNLRQPYTEINIVKELLLLADIAKLNNDELHIIAGWDGIYNKNEEELLKWISKKYSLEMVCVTLGDKGALLYDKIEIYRHNGFKVKVADTVGAGDAFLAGLISSLVNGFTAIDSLEFACAAGAFVASKTGGTPEYSNTDIQKIINSSN